MTRLKKISRLVGSICFTLILAAAPILQAAQQAADCAPVKSTCGCSCCGAAAEPADDEAVGQGSCGCTVADMVPANESPLDLQPRPDNQSETQANVGEVRPEVDVVRSPVVFSISAEVTNEHSPPLYLLHASYLI